MPERRVLSINHYRRPKELEIYVFTVCPKMHAADGRTEESPRFSIAVIVRESSFRVPRWYYDSSGPACSDPCQMLEIYIFLCMFGLDIKDST